MAISLFAGCSGLRLRQRDATPGEIDINDLHGKGVADRDDDWGRFIQLAGVHEPFEAVLSVFDADEDAERRDARQFTTALNRHLHIMKKHSVEDADRDALDEAKNAHRDRYSEAQMIAPEEVLMTASAVNKALNKAYGQVKRLERGAPDQAKRWRPRLRPSTRSGTCCEL